MVVASKLKPGMALSLEGQVFKVLQSEFKAGGGQTGGIVKSMLQNVVTGRQLERRFHPDEKLNDVPVVRHTMEFLYADDSNCIFMNPNTFEQVEVPRAALGMMKKFLEAGMNLPVEFCGDKPLSVSLPDVIETKILETAPPQHAQQGCTWKLERSCIGKR
jgi:elongation factor P